MRKWVNIYMFMDLAFKAFKILLEKKELFYFLFFLVCIYFLLGLVSTKPVFGVYDKASFKQISFATETS